MTSARSLSVILAAILVVLLAAGGPLTSLAQAQQSQPPARSDSDGAYEVGASAANVWYAPGRAIVCGGSVILAAAIMTITFGHSFDDATQIAKGGCSGPWLLRTEDIRNAAERKLPDAP